ncbi:MAG: Clp protease N-terminal domain-containing protein, partial [Longimicrobiales bacterium]
MLNFDRLTIKAGEALQEAANEGRRRGNPALEDVHLLSALLSQEETVVVPILQKVGVTVSRLGERLEAALEKLPKQTGGATPNVSRELNKVLDHADEEAKRLGDEYVSAEHLLLALAAEKGSTTKDLLAEQGATRDALGEALEAVRGSHRVTDQDPEQKYRALERFSRDQTDVARQGKLDPVIGRDEEI